MATIAVHEFITLDGVFEAPSWTFEYGFDPRMGETIGELTERSSTILLGRRTYEMFAPAWRDRTVEDDPGAPFFNETEKFVVGGQPLGEEWANTVALGAYDPAAIRRLKRERTGSSTSQAADSWCGHCCLKAWWTNCTCSSTRWPSARVRGSGARATHRHG